MTLSAFLYSLSCQVPAPVLGIYPTKSQIDGVPADLIRIKIIISRRVHRHRYTCPLEIDLHAKYVTVWRLALEQPHQYRNELFITQPHQISPIV